MILVEKKVRELKREMILLRQEKGKAIEEDEEEDEKEENEEEEGGEQGREDREEEPEKVAGEEEEKGNDEDDEDVNKDTSSYTESDTHAPSAGHRYGLRFRTGSKFSNTIDNPLVLTLSPPSSPQA